jgi:glutathione S-transferase
MSTSADLPEILYFDGAGRANMTRLAFVLGGVEFKDTRVSFAEWPAIKNDPSSVPSQLFGSLPVLKHGSDGVMLAQSIALVCYAAELGMYKKNPPSAAARSTDMMVVTTNEELKQHMYKCLFGDDESKAAGKEALPGKTAPLLQALERTLARSSTVFFSSSTEASLADLAVYDSITSPFPGLTALGIDLTAYPQLVACAEAVGKIDAVKAFAENGLK